MDEKAKHFFQKKSEELQDYKNKKLIEIGLSERIYSGNDTITDEFPYFDRNISNKLDKPMSYKIVPSEISDDEFKKILNILDEINFYKKNNEESVNKINIDNEKYNSENTFANILFFISTIIYLIGAIIGAFMGSISPYEFSWTTALTVWICTFISGTVFLGFREIIILLQQLVRNTENDHNF